MKHKKRKQATEINLSAGELVHITEQKELSEEDCIAVRMRMTYAFATFVNEESVNNLLNKMQKDSTKNFEISVEYNCENNREKYIGNIYGVKFYPNGLSEVCASVTKRYLNGKFIKGAK